MALEPFHAPVQQDLAPVSPAALGQTAALCWRLKKGQVEVLLVTSRETHRWVIPKGWPMPGMTAEAAAAREAWEEAGVLGQVSDQSLGAFVYDKILRDRSSRSCCVSVYPLRVSALKSRFPERKERRRKWFDAGAASAVVQEEGLSELLLALNQDPGLLAPATRRRKRQAAKG